MASGKKEKKQRSALEDIVVRDYTLHLAKHTFGRQFKKRSPQGIKAIRVFAMKQMQVKDVRIDPQLNKTVWARGIKNPPRRIRLRLSRKRNDDEDAKEKLYVYVQAVPVTSFKGLETQVVEQE